MEIEIDASGGVTSARAVAEDADPRLTAAAAAAVRQWSFEPGRRSGAPVASSVRVPVMFLPPLTELVESLSERPRAIYQVRPVYPKSMIKGAMSGEVLVRFVINVEGRVREAYVERSTHPGFDEAAVVAVERWRFAPGKKDGRPVNTRMKVPIVFRIESGGGGYYEVTRPDAFPADLPEAFHFDQPPELVGFAVPQYPLPALRAGTGGKVQLGFAVGPRGDVLHARSLGDTAAPELVAAAIAAVETFKFKPAAKEGMPGYAMLTFEFDFDPKGDGTVPVSPEALRLLRMLDEAPHQLVRLRDLDAAPQPRGRRPPMTPMEFRERRQPGEAVIEFIIDRKGFARLPRVIRASEPAFGYAAVQAVSTWRFDPPRKNGRPVDALVQIPIGFLIADD